MGVVATLSDVSNLPASRPPLLGQCRAGHWGWGRPHHHLCPFLCRPLLLPPFPAVGEPALLCLTLLCSLTSSKAQSFGSPTIVCHVCKMALTACILSLIYHLYQEHQCYQARSLLHPHQAFPRPVAVRCHPRRCGDNWINSHQTKEPVCFKKQKEYSFTNLETRQHKKKKDALNDPNIVVGGWGENEVKDNGWHCGRSRGWDWRGWASLRRKGAGESPK